MRLAIIFSAITFIGLSSATECRFGGGANLDKSAMASCLGSYRTDNWDGKNCGGRGWFKGHNAFWQDPHGCYDVCATCVSEGINQGANSVECEEKIGVAHCWMGYH